jgi:hypothetical protein
MNRIVKILMDRDGMSRKEAEEMLEESRKEVFEYGGFTSIEDILLSDFGLEADYEMDFIDDL